MSISVAATLSPSRLTGENGAARHGAGILHKRRIQELERRGLEPGRKYGRGGGDALLRPGEGQQEDGLAAGLIREPERELGYDAERALGAYDLGVFWPLGEPYRVPAGEDYLRVQHIVAGGAVFERAGAGGVGGGVAAYGRRLLARVGGIAQPVALGLGLHVLQQRAGLHAHGARRLVDAEDSVHVPQGEQDAPLRGHAAPRLPCPRPADSNRHTVGAAELQDVGNHAGGVRLDHRVRHRGLREGRLVLPIRWVDVPARIDAVLAGLVCQYVQEFAVNAHDSLLLSSHCIKTGVRTVFAPARHAGTARPCGLGYVS